MAIRGDSRELVSGGSDSTTTQPAMVAMQRSRRRLNTEAHTVPQHSATSVRLGDCTASQESSTTVETIATENLKCATCWGFDLWRGASRCALVRHRCAI